MNAAGNHLQKKDFDDSQRPDEGKGRHFSATGQRKAAFLSQNIHTSFFYFKMRTWLKNLNFLKH